MSSRLPKTEDSRKVSSLPVHYVGRGGIAVVWLGKRDDQYVAMKQFPIKANKLVDTSA